MNRIAPPILFLIALSLACAYLPSAPGAQGESFPSGTVLFQDDFAKATTGWDRLMTAEGIMDYDGGGYRILVNTLQTNFWSTPHKNFSDVRIEVDAGKLGGPDENRVGVLCRLTGSDYYFFMITNDGYYGMGVYANGQAVLLGQNEMQTSSNIKTGLAVNHLRADCIGNTLAFFINGFQVAQAQDSTLASGEVGLLAGTFAQPGVDVIFDSFVVLQP
jgi:hypothetical protein